MGDVSFKWIAIADDNGLKKYRDDGGELAIPDPFGGVPLLTAVARGRISAVQAFLDGKCSLTVRDTRGRMFVHYAALYDYPRLILQGLQLQLALNADKWHWQDDLHGGAYQGIEAFCTLLAPYGVPNPFEVKHDGDEDLVKEKPDAINLVQVLMDANFNASVRAVGGETPIHLAAEAGSARCIEILLSLFGKVNTKDNRGRIALHYAAAHDRPAVVGMLVAAGSSASEQDFAGVAPLHIAAKLGSVEMIQELRQAGANLNTLDGDGLTPLHYAAKAGQRDAVRELISLGADLEVRDVRGWAALRHAIVGGHSDVADLLTRAGTRPY